MFRGGGGGVMLKKRNTALYIHEEGGWEVEGGREGRA